MAVAPGLGGAAGRVALDQEDLALRRVALRTVGEFPRQRGAFQRGLAARQVPGFSRGLARARGGEALVQDRPRGTGVFLKVDGQLIRHHGIHQLAHLAVAQLGLGLALKLRLHELDGHDGREALADVLAGQAAVCGLQDAGFAPVVVDDAGQGRAEARQVRAALGGVDVVGEAEHALVEAVVPLHRDLHGGGVLHAFDVERGLEHDIFVLVQVLHEGHDAALVVVHPLLRGLGALVVQLDLDALVEKGHLAKARAQRVKVKIAGFEDARFRVLAGPHVRMEVDGCACTIRRADDFQVVEGFPALVLLLIELAVLVDVHAQVFRKRVDHRRAHAVQAAGNLVAAAAEFAAGVQHGEADLDRRTTHLGVDADGEAAAVVLHGYGAILMQRDNDVVAKTGQRLVHGVVHDFVNEVVQAALVGGANVHAGPAAHRLQAFQHLNLVFVVLLRAIGFIGHPGTS